MDRADGGHSSDPFTFGALALLLAALTTGRWAMMRRQPATLADSDDSAAAVSS